MSDLLAQSQQVLKGITAQNHANSQMLNEALQREFKLKTDFHLLQVELVNKVNEVKSLNEQMSKLNDELAELKAKYEPKQEAA